jgi:hypothetical protein
MPPSTHAHVKDDCDCGRENNTSTAGWSASCLALSHLHLQPHLNNLVMATPRWVAASEALERCEGRGIMRRVRVIEWRAA